MKNMKRLLALALALVMVMGLMTTAAFAADSRTVTVNGAAGHTFAAYQLFSGSLSSDGETLVDVKWAVKDTAGIIAALKKTTSFAGISDNADQALKDILKILDEKADDGDVAKEFAEAVGNYIANNDGFTAAGTAVANEQGVASLEVADGYYVILDVSPVTGDEAVDSRSRVILEVAGNDEDINIKNVVPELDKHIVEDTATASGTHYGVAEDDGHYREDVVGIGDVVTFSLESAIPDTTGYDYYYFIVHDTLSKGLSYVEGSLEVKIGGNVIPATDYKLTVTPNEDGTTSIKVNIYDVIEKYSKDDEVVITYKAKVNEDAVIGTAGNPNDANLEYSNDPTFDYDGSEGENPPENPPEEPQGPTGKTPEKRTVTYVTGVELNKIDGNEKTPLAGAVFTVEGEAIKTVLVSTEKFVEIAADEQYDGEKYYLDEDGEYKVYEDGDQSPLYKLVTVEEVVTSTEIVSKQITVGPDGKLDLTGLAPGTYTIKETAAPDGYNKLEGDITIEIKANFKDGKFESWTVTKTEGDGDPETLEADQSAHFSFTVANYAGSRLPSTGGIGTTIFYIVGACLVIGAGVLLITKKRLASQG